MNILQNEYPYHDKFNVNSLIKSIIHLQRNKLPSEPDYLISPNSLQYITCSTSKKGHVETITFIWEYLNLMNNNSNEKNNPNSIYIQPTEGLYENAVCTYAASRRLDHMVFGIISEMEEAGIKPTRNFLLRVSKAIRTRSSIKRVDHALHMMGNSYFGGAGGDEMISVSPTTSSLNILLAAFADFGFTSRAMDLYNEFDDFGCVPDGNTYSFLMNSIEMDISTTLPPMIGQLNNFGESQLNDDQKSWIESQLGVANSILNAATEMGCRSDEHLTDAYIKVLYSAADNDKALDFLGEKVQNGEKISSHTLGLLAVTNAELGNNNIVDEIIQLSKQGGYKSCLPRHFIERIDVLLSK